MRSPRCRRRKTCQSPKSPSSGDLKLDENLPERLVAALAALGHDVDTVRAKHLAGRDDADVWSAAQVAGRFLITQDLDFSDRRRYAPGTHVGLLLVRLDHPGHSSIKVTERHYSPWVKARQEQLESEVRRIWSGSDATAR